MPTLKRLHVATPGLKQDRSGQKVELTPAEISELASSYRPDLHSCKVAVDDVTTAIQLGAPAVLGHFDQSHVVAKGAMPAFGRILSADSDDRGLWLDLDVTDSLASWMKEGLYDHVSLSWYARNDSRNPTPGKLHLRHLGILGSEPSGMKDLQLPDLSHDLYEFSESKHIGSSVYHTIELTTHLEFSEITMNSSTAKDKADVVYNMAEGDTAEPDQEVTDEQTDPVQLLISTLTGGPKGYKGEITGFIPEPTADNTYLWNADKQQFAGQFLDNTGNEEEVYDFDLTLQSDGSMIRSYKRNRDGEEPVDEDTVEAEADIADEPAAAEFSEGMSSSPLVSVSTQEYDRLKAQDALYSKLLAEMAEMKRQVQIEEIQDALLPMYDMGLLDPSLSSAEVARALLAMSDSSSDCCDYSYEFSEGVTYTRPVDTVLAMFSQVATKAKVLKETDIEFGEMSVPSADETPQQSNQPAGVVANTAQAKVDQKARQYCKDNGLDPKDTKSYIKAVKAVS